MDEDIQKAVSRAVWHWDAPPAPVADEGAKLRRKALIQAAVMLLVAFLFMYFLNHRIMPMVLSILAVLTVVLGLVAPSAFGRVDGWLNSFGHLAGQGTTWLLLTPFYYLVFVPARLILAIRGKDPLHRRFPDTPATYWIPHRPASGADDYRKQF